MTRVLCAKHRHGQQGRHDQLRRPLNRLLFHVNWAAAKAPVPGTERLQTIMRGELNPWFNRTIAGLRTQRLTGSTCNMTSRRCAKRLAAGTLAIVASALSATADSGSFELSVRPFL